MELLFQNIAKIWRLSTVIQDTKKKKINPSLGNVSEINYFLQSEKAVRLYLKMFMFQLPLFLLILIIQQQTKLPESISQYYVAISAFKTQTWKIKCIKEKAEGNTFVNNLET